MPGYMCTDRLLIPRPAYCDRSSFFLPPSFFFLSFFLLLPSICSDPPYFFTVLTKDINWKLHGCHECT